MRAIRSRISWAIRGCPPRQRPRDRYRQIEKNPWRRHHSTASGWAMINLFRQPDHQCDNRTQNNRSGTRKQGATRSAAPQHCHLVSKRDQFRDQRGGTLKCRTRRSNYLP